MTHTLGRPDFSLIAGWVKPGDRVLDLGCGDGALLQLLEETHGVRGYGIENDPANVLAAIEKGVNVMQSDVDAGLAGFEDGAFDHVVMSQSLQAMRHTQAILTEILRVGREAVVSFPNFAYWKNRQAILNGHMPVSERLPYQWFDSPNVRFFTIDDFEALCGRLGLSLRDRRFFDDDDNPVTEEVNFLGSLAVYRLSR